MVELDATRLIPDSWYTVELVHAHWAHMCFLVETVQPHRHSQFLHFDDLGTNSIITVITIITIIIPRILVKWVPTRETQPQPPKVITVCKE